MGLYENVKTAAKAKGYSINKLEQELGFARSYITKFKTITPSADKVQKIADFLGVSTNYLLYGNEPTSSQGYYLNDDAMEYAQFLFENPEYKVLFDVTRKVKKEDIAFVKEMIDRTNRNDE